MKKSKKILSLILAITILAAVASLSVLAIDEWTGPNGCYKTAQDRSNNETQLRRTLEICTGERVAASGSAYNEDSSYTLKTPVAASAYCTDCDLFGWDPGTGWMGNPGYATAYVDIDGYECVGAYVEYYYYENNVLCAVRDLSWSNTENPNN